MDIWITGGGWVTARGYGRMSDGGSPVLSPGLPVIPLAREVFNRPLSRYGRFDTFTRMGCAAAALTLKDAGLEEEEGHIESIGMVVSSLYEVMETDISYYQTTLEQGGVLSSPNLFSYTLPVIVLGECAVLFHLTGPTFCVGEGGGTGMNAVQSAAAMISSGKTDKMIAGWIDSPPDDILGGGIESLVSGAAFIMLDAKPANVLSSSRRMVYDKGRILMDNDREASSLTDLFNMENKNR